MKRLQGLMFALATVVLVVLATYFFMDDWLPPLVSDRGAIDSALWISLVVTGVVFIVTNLLLAWFSWRYQDREGAEAAYWHENHKLEWTWTAATAIIMTVFVFKSLSLWAEVRSDAPDDAMVVEVTGQQFRWVIRYPGADGEFGPTDVNLIDVDDENYIGVDRSDPAGADDIIAVNELYLVKDRPIRVRLRSTDVIHSFFLPNFRVKQDTMPGLTIETWFVPTETGNFEIACAEHCGLGHYRMRGFVYVVEADEFAASIGL